MRKLVVAVVLGGLVALGGVQGPAPADAHNCGTGEPEEANVFAQHHIKPLAREGALGADTDEGHVPGHHQGFAGLCGVLAP